MARTRSIKPGFFDNEILGGLAPLTRLLFIGLWCQADREGRLEDRPRKLKKTILGYDDLTAEDVDNMLSELDSSGFIIRYQVEETQYIQVINFVKHQNPHMKEKASEIPPPPGFTAQLTHQEGSGPEQEEQAGSTGPAPGQHGEGHGEGQGEPGSDGKKKSTVERRFELFWKAYPKKTAKKAAWAAFSKVKPDTDLFERIMAAIGKAKTTEQWQRENGRFIPNPATWLNQGRWDDEIPDEEVGNGGDSGKHSGGNRRREPAAPAGGQGGDALRGFKQED